MRQAMIFRKLFAVICLAVVCASSAAAALENENLLVVVPDGYKSGFRDRKNNMIINEMVPVAQTVENWTEMVTVQIFLGMQGVTPEQFRARMEGLWSKACANATSHPIANAVENGYPAAVWLMTCPRNRDAGKPEYTWFKAIQGNDSFYVVQKAFKFEPSKEQIAAWTLYLKRVTACDTRLPERACPNVNIKQ
jgi:hypothetical protein